MDPRLSCFAMGALFGLMLCGWPWHPRFSRYSCRRNTACGGGVIGRQPLIFNEGRTMRGNGSGGPTTPKPELPQPRIIREDFLP